MQQDNSFILWLPSWYPNKLKPFDGDFIQRHAQAAALYNKIYVIKIVADEAGAVTNDVKTDISTQGNLTEEIIYYKKTASFFGIPAAYRAMRLYRHGIKNCISKNGKPRLVHVHVAMKAGLLALWIKRKYKIPFLVSEHWTIYQPGSRDEFRKRSFFFRQLSRRVIKKSTVLLTVSNDLGQQIRKIVFPKKFQVIPNVANESFFCYKPHSISKFRFIHVSDMDSRKNVEAILENFAVVQKNFPDIELVLIGLIDNKLFRVAENMGLLNKAIFFRGEIAYEKVAIEFQNSHALVLFSHFENQPCVIIEALCCGIPVISSPVGGIPEIINPANGILTNGHTLAEAMKKMIIDYRFFDSKKISEHARNKFGYTVVGKMFYHTYTSTLSEILRLENKL
jgi:glycosyltransferase involved in cell wall biosynthesis